MEKESKWLAKESVLMTEIDFLRSQLIFHVERGNKWRGQIEAMKFFAQRVQAPLLAIKDGRLEHGAEIAAWAVEQLARAVDSEHWEMSHEASSPGCSENICAGPQLPASVSWAVKKLRERMARLEKAKEDKLHERIRVLRKRGLKDSDIVDALKKHVGKG